MGAKPVFLCSTPVATRGGPMSQQTTTFPGLCLTPDPKLPDGAKQAYDDEFLASRKAGETTKAAVYMGNLWDPGTQIRVAFLDGDPFYHQKVQEHLKEWTDSVNIGFEFVPANDPTALVRVSFAFNRVYDSQLGRDAHDRLLGQGGYTMPSGSTPSTSARRTGITFTHSTSSATSSGSAARTPSPAGTTIQWNKRTVIDYYMNTNPMDGGGRPAEHPEPSRLPAGCPELHGVRPRLDHDVPHPRRSKRVARLEHRPRPILTGTSPPATAGSPRCFTPSTRKTLNWAQRPRARSRPMASSIPTGSWPMRSATTRWRWRRLPRRRHPVRPRDPQHLHRHHQGRGHQAHLGPAEFRDVFLQGLPAPVRTDGQVHGLGTEDLSVFGSSAPAGAAGTWSVSPRHFPGFAPRDCPRRGR